MGPDAGSSPRVALDLQDWLVLLLLVLLPLQKLYWDVGARLRPWYLIAPIAFAVACRGARRGPPIPRAVSILCVGLWLVALGVLASGLWAIDVREWFNNAVDLALGVAAAIAIALTGARPGRARLLVTWWIAIGAALSVYGVVQWVAGTRFGIDLDAYTVEVVSRGLRRSGLDVYASYLRVTSLIQDSSSYSLYLCTVWPLALFRLVWCRTRRERLLYLVAFMLLVANLALTLARSGIVGSLAALPLVFVLIVHAAEAERRTRAGTRRLLARQPAQLLFFATTIVVFTAVALRGAVSYIIDLRTQNSVGTKIHLAALDDSFRLMIDRPWGVGFGGFARWFQINRRPWEPAQWATFNSYTDVGSTAGLVALAGYLVVIVGLGVRLWWARRSDLARTDACGALVGLVAIAIGAFGYNTFGAGFFVGFVGIAAAAATDSRRPATRLETS